MSEEPAIYRINGELKEVRDQSAANHEEINDIANEHEFNFWWYKTGHNIAPYDGEDPEAFVNRIARASYMHARSLPALPALRHPSAHHPTKSSKANLLFGLFALGVVVGIAIAILTRIFTFN